MQILWKITHSLLFPIFWLLMGYLISVVFNLTPDIYLPTIILLGSLALSVSLFANVQSIDKNFFKEYKKEAIVIVTVGLIFKALLLGGIMYFFTNDMRFFLVATLMSQIDPTFTNWAQRMLGVSGDAAKLGLVESTFDDPVSTLLTLYIALPFMVQGDIKITFYLIMLALNLIFVGVFIFFKNRSKLHHDFLSPTLVVLGGIFSVFLGVALSGLFFRVKKEIFDEPINLITYFSYIMIGLLMVTTKLEILPGIALGFVLVYLVRPLEVLLFFRKLNLHDRFLLSFGEQKGITTLLLLLIVQPQINILGIVLPAMLTVNALFFVNNLTLKYFSKSNYLEAA